MDPDPALFAIYGSGSGYRLFNDTKIIFSQTISCLFHISFDYEGIPFKDMKRWGKILQNLIKSQVEAVFMNLMLTLDGKSGEEFARIPHIYYPPPPCRSADSIGTFLCLPY